MMAFLFLMFLVAAVTACLGKPQLSLGLAYASLLATLLWFRHHATDSLSILL